MDDQPHLVIITGMSGAGRSHAAKALEDLGYFVIDNLPADLISHVVARADLPEGRHSRLAVVADARGGLDFGEVNLEIRKLAAEGVPTTTLFLEADDDVLIQRFEESRRPHPLRSETLADAIADERELLTGIRDAADVMVDTSDLNVHQLREIVTGTFSGGVEQPALQVLVSSFGFKHGAPRVADLLFDVRFLPNPHWVDELRPLTGLDVPVREHVIGDDDAQTFLRHLEELMRFLIPRYQREGKSYLSIGIGCTGGRHRSVAIAEHLGSFLEDLPDLEVTVRHRDVNR